MNEISKDIYLKFRGRMIKFCVRNKITANEITIFTHCLTLSFGCYFFSRGTYWAGLAGLAVCGINVILDYLDGDLAKATGTSGSFGAWIDSGFDLIVQQCVLGAIAIGCVKGGMGLIWVILYFIGNAGNNLVGLTFNNVFGFSSSEGNTLFRNYMDLKGHLINMLLKNVIDPTSSFAGLAIFTCRYWILFGLLFGIMPIYFIAITIIVNFRWMVMFVIYGMHLKEMKHLHVLVSLAVLDEERKEHYEIRKL